MTMIRLWHYTWYARQTMCISYNGQKVAKFALSLELSNISLTVSLALQKKYLESGSHDISDGNDSSSVSEFQKTKNKK